MHEFSAQELLSACRVLFGRDVVLTRDFLWYLQLEGAKSAFWKKAKESHPDSHPDADVTIHKTLAHDFNRVTESYQLLCSFLHFREQTKFTAFEMFGPERIKVQEARCREQHKSGLSGELYFNGTIPHIEIKTGKYLYFRGLTSFQSIIKALTWQREQRPLIGSLARQWGWLDDHTVRSVLMAKHLPGRFGERALTMGALTIQQHKKLINYQQSCQQRIGLYFVLNGMVNEREMEALARERIIHNNLVRNARKNKM